MSFIINLKRNIRKKLGINPTREFPRISSQVELIFNTVIPALNGISFGLPVESLKMFGPADDISKRFKGSYYLKYTNFGLEIYIDEGHVVAFECVFDATWRPSEYQAHEICKRFTIKLGNGRSIDLHHNINESSVTEIFGEPSDRFHFSNGDLCCQYLVDHSDFTLTFNSDGSSLRHCEVL